MNSRAPYSPSAIRQWAQDPTRESQLLCKDIDCERYSRRHGISRTSDSTMRTLHPQFCLDIQDRMLAWHEGVSDVRDAVVGMSRLSDVLFVGFAVRPEWDLNEPLHWSNIHVETIVSEQVPQSSSMRNALNLLTTTIRKEIAVPHIMGYRARLNEITPGAGYVIDVTTHQIRLQDVVLAGAPSQPIATPRDSELQTPTHTSRQHTSTQSCDSELQTPTRTSRQHTSTQP
ncbi:hypothetical protein F4604DRAFT_1927023 [Suillus subluteus]|nr:hypothetical protein F4604DRAFT_1927023 [Suillus subluteus]